MHGKTSKLVESIHKQLSQCNLAHARNRFLLGVSGGIDSMALLHTMAGLATKYDWILQVAHLNHGLRMEADADSDFVQQVCRDYGIPFTSKVVDVARLAKVSGHSIEIEARLQRYAFFAECYRQMNATALLTAHTRNDQAETILLNLARGCSPGSLSGIHPDSQRQNMRIIRPMLHISRNDILFFMQEYQFTWQEDQSNNDLQFRRNSVRHVILPAIRGHLNPSADEALIRCSEMAAEDETWLQVQAQRATERIFCVSSPCHLSLPPYRKEPPPIRRRVIVHWLRQHANIHPADMRYETIRNLDQLALHGKAGSTIKLPNQHQVRHIYNHLVLETSTKTASHDALHPIHIPGTTQIPELAIRIEACLDLGFKIHSSSRPGLLPASCHIRIPSADEPLYIRTRRDGDRIQMTGSSGHTKLKQILSDAKIPQAERDNLPLLATDRELVWIPGLRIAQSWIVPTSQSPSLLIQIDSPTHPDDSGACALPSIDWL